MLFPENLHRAVHADAARAVHVGVETCRVCRRWFVPAHHPGERVAHCRGQVAVGVFVVLPHIQQLGGARAHLRAHFSQCALSLRIGRLGRLGLPGCHGRIGEQPVLSQLKLFEDHACTLAHGDRGIE